LLATGDTGGSVHLWDAASGAALAKVGDAATPPGQVWQLQFASTNRYLAVGGERGVAAWEVRHASGGVKLHPFIAFRHSSGVIDLAVRPGGAELVFVDRLWNLYTYDVAHAAGPQL